MAIDQARLKLQSAKLEAKFVLRTGRVRAGERIYFSGSNGAPEGGERSASLAPRLDSLETFLPPPPSRREKKEERKEKG